MRLDDGENVSQTKIRRVTTSIPITYTVWKDGSNYRAESGDGSLADIAANSSAATVIHNAWAAMTDGGRIHFVGDIDLGTTPLALKLTYLGKGLQLTGEGETRSKLTYTGTGYAITIDTDDVSIGQYTLLLDGFQLTGSAKTGGRHGIKVSEVGQWSRLNGLFVRQMDTAINIDSTNSVTVDNTRLRTCNTGIKLTQSGGLGVHGTVMRNIRALGITNYGIHLNGAGANVNVDNLVTDTVGTGIYCDEHVRALLIRGCYLSCSTADINLVGIDWATPIKGVAVDSCHLESSVTSHIITGYVDNLSIKNCESSGATNFIAPRSDYRTIIMDENNYVLDTNLSSNYAKLRVSPTWDYMDYTNRMTWMSHTWYDSATNFIVNCVKSTAFATIGHNVASSWLSNSVVGYGTYEWKAKFGTRDTAGGAAVGKIIFGLEKHHGHPTEGIIALYDDNTNYLFWTYTDGGVNSSTNINAWINPNTEYTFRIQWDDTPRCKLSIDGTQRANHTNVPTASCALFGESTVEGANASQDMFCYWRNRSFKQTSTFP